MEQNEGKITLRPNLRCRDLGQRQHFSEFKRAEPHPRGPREQSFETQMIILRLRNLMEFVLLFDYFEEIFVLGVDGGFG